MNDTKRIGFSGAYVALPRDSRLIITCSQLVRRIIDCMHQTRHMMTLVYFYEAVHNTFDVIFFGN